MLSEHLKRWDKYKKITKIIKNKYYCTCDRSLCLNVTCVIKANKEIDGEKIQKLKLWRFRSSHFYRCPVNAPVRKEALIKKIVHPSGRDVKLLSYKLHFPGDALPSCCAPGSEKSSGQVRWSLVYGQSCFWQVLRHSVWQSGAQTELICVCRVCPLNSAKLTVFYFLNYFTISLSICISLSQLSSPQHYIPAL